MHEARWIREEMAGVVASQPLAHLGYAAVVDVETWEDVERIRRPRPAADRGAGRRDAADRQRDRLPARVRRRGGADAAGPASVENRPMLLAIDTGNTETVVGVFRGRRAVAALAKLDPGGPHGRRAHPR